MDVGEVLDLRYRQQADVPRTLRNAQDRGLVEQRVEDAPGTEPPLEIVGHVVDAALAGHVFAEDDHLGTPCELVGEGGVDLAGERASVWVRSLLRQGSFEGRATSVDLQYWALRTLGDRLRVVGRQRGHHRIRGGQSRTARSFVGGGHHPLSGVSQDFAQGLG